ncbi:ATP-binding protein [Nesterenkonia suensis]
MDGLAAHLATCEEQGIHQKSAVMEHAVIRRGLPYRRLSRYVIVVEPPGQGPVIFYNMLGPSTSHAGGYLADTKHLSRQLLAEAGVSVPESRTFIRDERQQAWHWAQACDRPVVIKPTRLSRGRGVTTEIRTEDEFHQAWDRAFEAYGRSTQRQLALVEQHFSGEDYRCFVVGGRLVSVTMRRRASVVGDGSSTIRALIEAKNRRRAGHPMLHSYPIPDSPESLEELTASGMTLQDVPAEGARVTLRRVSNLASGGDSIDVTDTIHPGFAEIAQQAVEAIPGVECLGVDLIATSITEPPTAESHVVTEVETAPMPMTEFPVEGQPRDMAGAVLEHHFAE